MKTAIWLQVILNGGKKPIHVTGDCISSADSVLSSDGNEKQKRIINSVKEIIGIKVIYYSFFKYFKCTKGFIALLSHLIQTW